MFWISSIYRKQKDKSCFCIDFGFDFNFNPPVICIVSEYS